jgi:hypothetical protein
MTTTPTASRFLCKMHNLGLGVGENQALIWAWIKWAKAHCRPSDHPGEAMEVNEAYDFYQQWLDEATRAEGERVIAALLRPVPKRLRDRPLPRVRFKRRRMRGSGDEQDSA